MKSNDSILTHTRFHVDTICSVSVPFLLKRFAVISSEWYLILLGASFATAIMLFLLYKKNTVKSNKPAIMCSALAIAIGLSLLISSNIKIKNESRQLSLSLNTTFRDKYEKAADNGDVHYMVIVGAYYSFLSNQKLIPAPRGDIRDDEMIDTRDFIKANRYLEMAAEHNSADAYSLLGEMKYQGLGCIPSQTQAMFYFQKAFLIDSHNSLLKSALQMHNIPINELVDSTLAP